MEDIKNIIFDLGGVLVDIRIDKSVEAFRKLNIKGLDVSDIHPHQKGFFLDYELGLISTGEFIACIRCRYDCSAVDDAAIRSAWNVLLQDIDMRRFRLLERLRKKYRLFLLSNTNELHIGELRRNFRETSGGTEFESYFDGCFYSHVMHLRKPDARVYSQVIETTGIDPAQTIFIDDNDCNFSGALSAGLNVYHLTGGETILDFFGDTVE